MADEHRGETAARTAGAAHRAIGGAFDLPADGLQAIADERHKQLQRWSRDHDATDHEAGDLAAVALLALAAAVYGAGSLDTLNGADLATELGITVPHWAAALAERTAKAGPARLLEVAGALIAAELDRTWIPARRAPVVNRPKVERLVDTVRQRLLRREVSTEVVDGRAIRFVPVAPELLELLADVADAGLLALGAQIRAIATEPGDLLVLKSDDPRGVPMRALELMSEALEASLLRSGLGVEKCGRVLVLGEGMELEQLSAAQLRALGLALIEEPGLTVAELPPALQAKIAEDDRRAELQALAAAERQRVAAELSEAELLTELQRRRGAE